MSFCPYLQNCRKKYIGFKANEKNLPLTMKGISEKNSSELKMQLNKMFVTSLLDTFCLTETMNLVYHYIGKNIVTKLKDMTLDPHNIATRHSNSKINLKALLSNPNKYKTKKFEI